MCLLWSATKTGVQKYDIQPLLRVCKRIHLSVTRLFHMNNKFCFTPWMSELTVTDTVSKFCITLSDFQSGLIRKLHLQMRAVSNITVEGHPLSNFLVEQGWKPLFEDMRQPSLQMLTGLQELSLEFKRTFNIRGFWNFEEKNWSILFIPLNDALRGIKFMGLKKVAVFIWYAVCSSEEGLGGRSCWDEDLERRIEAWLLEPEDSQVTTTEVY